MYCCLHFRDKIDDLVFCMSVQKCQFYLGLDFMLEINKSTKLFLFDQLIIFIVFHFLLFVFIIK